MTFDLLFVIGGLIVAGKCPSVPRRCFTLVGDDVWGQRGGEERKLQSFENVPMLIFHTGF